MLTLEAPVKLYQYDVCPFCNKVQAFMEYHGVPFEKVEVNPLSKEEIKFSEYRMVPFAIVNGEQVNGSAHIIDTLLAGNSTSEGERKWCEWVDDHLVHVLPVNIYRTPSEALQAFDYITESSNFSAFDKITARYFGALAMYFVAKRSKTKYNLGDDARQELYTAVEHWTREGLTAEGFHGGKHPDTADLAVFGVLRSIDGNYDAWSDLRAQDLEGGDRFWAWYEHIKGEISKQRRP